MITSTLPIVIGLLAGLALCAVAAIFVPTTPDIGDTLERLYDPDAARRARAASAIVAADTTWVDRLGVRVQRRTRFIPTLLSSKDMEALELSPARLYGMKAVVALLGASLSVIFAAFEALMGAPAVTIPGLVAVLLCVGGWFLPDLLSKGQAATKREEFTRTVTSYYDLVTLMRLSGASVTTAITTPAQIADAPLFVRIRGTMARQQLEHRRPWDGLNELAQDIDLPELRDLAEMMALSGDRGTPAAPTLRAKAADIRSDRLNQDMEVAQRDLQRSTIYQVLLLGVIIALVAFPPLLRLVLS